MAYPVRTAAPLLSALLGLCGGAIGWGAGEVVLILLPAAPTASTAVPPPADTSPPDLLSPLPPYVPPPQSFADQLTRVGAPPGEVQVILTWDGPNDLDLHSTGPDGYDICSATRDSTSPTGGRIEADANTACYATEAKPVEVISWRTRAPAGAYRVYVEGFERCPSGAERTAFRVAVLSNGRWAEFAGEVVFPDRGGKKLVHEFEVATRVQPPPALQAEPPAAPSATYSPPMHATLPAIWIGTVVGSVAFVMALGRNHASRKRPLVWVVATIVCAAAIAVGVSTGAGARAVDRQLGTATPGVGFALAWLVLGGALAVSELIHRKSACSFKRVVAVGVAGGLLGVIGFFVARTGGDWAGRLAAALPLGLAAGVAAGRRDAPVAPIPTAVVTKSSTTPISAAKPPPIKPPAVPPVAKPTVTKSAAIPPPAVPTARAATPLPKPAAADACPTCGRKNPGAPGQRYCVVCDRNY